MAQRLLGLDKEIICIIGRTEGIGANGTHIMRVKITQSLSKTAQTGQCPPLCIHRQLVANTQSLGEPDRLPDAVHDPQGPALQAGDNHVEAVGTKINGCNNPGIRFTDVGVFHRARRDRDIPSGMTLDEA
jgi:hypothetical protein